MTVGGERQIIQSPHALHVLEGHGPPWRRRRLGIKGARREHGEQQRGTQAETHVELARGDRGLPILPACPLSADNKKQRGDRDSGLRADLLTFFCYCESPG